MVFGKAWIALAAVALFAGFAVAQVPVPVAMNQIPCQVFASANPNIRAEGAAERVGDVVITCSSNLIQANGTAADRATITVNYGVPVTSHADSATTSVGGASYYASEALLLIDEPNTVPHASAPVPGYGQDSAIYFCAFNTSCAAQLAVTGGYYTMADATGVAPGANAYQGGVQTGSSNGKITFFNVPIIPPGPNATRVYRIVNVRVTPGSGAITPTVAVTAASGAVNGLVLTNSSATVATPAASMTTSVTSVSGVSLCQAPLSTTLGAANKLSLLTFKEAYNNAWKTQTLPLTDVAGAAENQTPTEQKVANGTYAYGSALLSETGVYDGHTAGGVAIGLGDYGTRFKVVFSNLPLAPAFGQPGTRFWISATNVADISNGLAAPANIGGQTQGAYAVMVGQSGSGATNLNTVERTAWSSIVAPTLGASFANPANATTINFVQVVPVVSGSLKGQAEVVYELTNLTKNAINTLNFALYVTYTNGTAAPAVGNTATVQLGYAPFDIANPGATPPVSATYAPRFTAAAMTPANFFNVLPCQTSLLFPYVVGVLGYSTGIAISNTSVDPYGTASSHGTCTLSFYSSPTPVNYTTADVPAGTTYLAALNTGNQLSDSSPVGTTVLTGFGGVGYMFATCNFQYAHGFAFIDNGAGSANAMSMGYLPTVVANTSRGIALAGESLGY